MGTRKYEEGKIMGLAQILRQEGRLEEYEKAYQEGYKKGYQQGRQEECISIMSRLLRRKFGIQPEQLDQSLAQLQTLPVEKLEDLIEQASLKVCWFSWRCFFQRFSLKMPC